MFYKEKQYRLEALHNLNKVCLEDSFPFLQKDHVVNAT